MTTNKTPIQEFKEYVFNTFEPQDNHLWLKQTILFLETLEQKEKAFAFDCFKAGEFMHGCDTIAAFDQFYCKYAE